MNSLARRLHDSLGLRTTPGIFFGAALVVILFTAAMSLFPGPVQGFFGAIATFLRYDLGWFFTGAVTLMVIFAFLLAVSRYGRVKLGDDDAEPEYSGVTWFGMLFAAGVGAVLMFWGVAEPMNHYANPPMTGTEPFSDQAVDQAMSIANFHFAFHMWAILVVPGLAFGYFTYKRKLPPRVSSAFQPLLGDGIHGPIGKAIDILAIVATVFGLSVSVGLGALQINAGANYVFGLEVAGWVQAVILAVITAVGLMSVLAGMDKGVKRLSYANILMAVALLLFILMFGATTDTFRAMVESTGRYLGDLPVLSFFNDLHGHGEWSGDWTVFYWAWTVTWAPFVGMFVAKISRGRTIREFVVGTIGAPSAFVVVWMAIYGYNGVVQDRATAPGPGQGGDLTQTIVEEENVQAALFQFLQGFPFYEVTAVLALIVITLFFITSIDSGALVMDAMSNGHEDEGPRRQRVFWTVSIGAVCAAIILTAGENGLDALQEVIIVVGFPVTAMTFLQMMMVIQALREDAGSVKPMRTRQWKRVLPAEEYRRRSENADEDMGEYVIRPEFEPGTEPEYDTHTPQTHAVRVATEGMPALRIAVTGGAASGASVVVRALGERGAVVIDTDAVARTVLEEDAEVQDEVRAVFGEDVVSADGVVDRSALGHLVFASRDARLRLEEILHPRIIAEVDRMSRQAGPDSVVVVDAPLLVEAHQDSRFDQVVAVSAPVEQRVERLMAEQGLSREDAWARLDARLTDTEREDAAGHVIHNVADVEALKRAADEYWDQHVVPVLDPESTEAQA